MISPFNAPIRQATRSPTHNAPTWQAMASAAGCVGITCSSRYPETSALKSATAMIDRSRPPDSRAIIIASDSRPSCGTWSAIERSEPAVNSGPPIRPPNKATRSASRISRPRLVSLIRKRRGAARAATTAGSLPRTGAALTLQEPR